MISNKKLIAAYIVALVLLLLLLVGFLRLDSPSEILSPPSLYGQGAEIQAAFETAVGNQGIRLHYPSQGEYRSAFVLSDLDNDKVDEAIVFYSSQDDEATVRINILDCVDDDWVSVYDDAGYGVDILKVDFADLNRDGKCEVVCCWQLYESTSSNVLTVHSVEFKDDKVSKLVPLANQAYTFTDIVDLDGDSADEIFIAWIDITDPTVSHVYANMLKFDENGKLSNVGKNIALDSSVTNYGSLKIQNMDGNIVAFLDAYKGDDSMITEVIRWDKDKNQLVSIFNDSLTHVNSATMRSPAIPSYDYDGDGVIEIPISVSLSGSAPEISEDSNENLLNVSAWCSVKDGKLQTESFALINETYKFAVKIPSSLKNHLLAYESLDGDSTTVYYTENGSARGKVLFVINGKYREDSDAKLDSAFSAMSKEIYVYGNITDAGIKAGLSNEFIEKGIVFLDDIK